MKNTITYENRNGYLYPLLTLPTTKEAPIGKYGWMYLDYLKKHRRGTYISLLTSGNLGKELSKFDAEVRNEVDLILARLIDERGITEALKAANPLRWAQEMNTAKHDAEESVLYCMITRNNNKSRGRICCPLLFY